MVVDHLGDDEAQELLGEHRVEPRLDGERAQPRDLRPPRVRDRPAGDRPAPCSSPTAWVILNRSASRCTSAASMLSMLARYRSSCSSLMGNRNGLRRATLPEHRCRSGVRYGPPTMDDTALPVLFFDGGLPDLYRDLIEGRAVAVGPGRRRHRPRRCRDRRRSSARGTRRCSRRARSSACVSRTGVGYDNVEPRRRRGRRRRRLLRPSGADGVDRRAHDRADAGRHQAPARCCRPAPPAGLPGATDRRRRSSSTARRWVWSASAASPPASRSPPRRSG